MERSLERLANAGRERPNTIVVDAFLERTRRELESLATSAAELETTLPSRVGQAVREGVRSEAAPVGRQLAEVRGLVNQAVRRLQRIEGDLTAERFARVDDLDLLVDLVVSGWRTVDERLGRIEVTLESRTGATVHQLDERRSV